MRLSREPASGALWRMMLSRAPRRDPNLERGERHVVAAIAFFVFGMFALDVARDYQPLKLSVLFMVLVWAPLVAIHEAGHALVAAVLGWRVCRVVIGMGRALLRFGVYGVPVEVRLFPAGGYVLPAPRDLRHARLKSALVYFAGPGAELLVLAVVIAVIGRDALFTRSDDPAIIFAQSVAVVVALGVGVNLVPLSAPEGGWTDGLGIVKSGFLPREHFERSIASAHRLEVERHVELGDLDAAVRRAAQALARHPDNASVLLLLGEALVEAGRPQEARDQLAPGLERAGLPVLFRIELLCAIAEAEREMGETEIPSAERHCEQALELAPEHPRALLVHGSVLLERGRFHEARRSIQKAHAAIREATWDDECESWLVLVDFRRGSRDDAREALDRLHRRGARGRLLDAVSAEVRGIHAPATEPAGPAP